MGAIGTEYRNRVVVPARQATSCGGIDSLESIPGLLKSLKILPLPSGGGRRRRKEDEGDRKREKGEKWREEEKEEDGAVRKQERRRKMEGRGRGSWRGA
jgi:hypothetical protein